MPRGNERVGNNAERVVRRGASTSSRKSPNRIIYTSCLEERLPYILDLRDSEQRCAFLYTVVDHGSSIILVPLGVLLQGNEGRKKSGSEAKTSIDYFESLEQWNNFPERPGSAESCTCSSSSGMSILGKSRTRSNQTKSVKNISTASDVLNSTSGSGFDLVSLGESVDSISEVEKPVKNILRKKRKKKGKRCRRSRQKDDSIASQSEEGIYHVSVSETSISCHRTFSREHISQNMLERVACHVLAVPDIVEGDCAEKSDDGRNNRATTLTCTSSNDEVHSLEPDASSSERISGKKFMHGHLCEHENVNDDISSCPIASSEIMMSTASGNRLNVHPKQNGSSEPHPFLDKLKIDAVENSIDVEKCGNASKQPYMKDHFSEGRLVLDFTEHNAPFQSSTAESYDPSIEMPTHFSMDRSDLSNCLVDADSDDERVHCSSEASSSNDFQPVVYRKKGRLGRNTSFNSNSLCRSGSLNFRYWAEKDNNHQLWRKNQKNVTKGCISETKRDNLVNQHVKPSSKRSEVQERSGKVKVWKKNETKPLCSTPSSDGKIDETADMDPIEPASGDVNTNDFLYETNNARFLQNFQENLKRTSSSPSGQECQGIINEIRSSTIKMARESTIHIQEGVEMPLQVINHQQIGSPSISLCTTEVDCGPSESPQSKQSNNLEAQHGIRSLPTESDQLEIPYTKVHSIGSNSEDSRSMPLEIESMHSDSSLEVTLKHELTSDMLELGMVKLESPNSDFHQLAPSNSGSSYLVCHSQEADSTCSMLHKVDELSHRFGSSLVEGDAIETLYFTGFETDLYKIIQAVDESYRLLTASEVIHQMTGTSIAEFEKLLYSVSPSIGQSIRDCKARPRDPIIGDGLCLHQVPRISLGNLWQWYEKPGCYGLQVKVEDHLKSKKSHNGSSQFRAYFVPSLSAVQLFAQTRTSVHLEAKEFCDEDKTSESSDSLKSLPIFSMLLPRPCNIVSSGKDEVYTPTISSSNLTNEELLFEYFEDDRPQHRRPLFEKIDELVRGGTSGDCKMFGAPSNLECLNLHDLHPASWFSVAWYPIYRIPDGKFRAAFLTYHSIGQFVQRSDSSNITSDVARIVYPVVGMQSYNAKGENWFVESEFSSNVCQTGKAMSPNPSETLRERLKTLEHAASVMSRAIVRKGNQKSINRHPDYEFFLSRGR